MARRVAVMPVALVAAAFLLSACGRSTGDRGLSGAGIGAAAGTAVGVVTGLSIVEGALIGAAGGGITAALTDADTIALGKSWWESGRNDLRFLTRGEKQGRRHCAGFSACCPLNPTHVV